MRTKAIKLMAAGLTLAAFALQPAAAFEIGVIGFQFSSETHARVANAATAAAKGGNESIRIKSA